MTRTKCLQRKRSIGRARASLDSMHASSRPGAAHFSHVTLCDDTPKRDRHLRHPGEFVSWMLVG